MRINIRGIGGRPADAAVNSCVGANNAPVTKTFRCVECFSITACIHNAVRVNTQKHALCASIKSVHYFM